MTICGVVAEYNPFHNGHVYHLEQTRAKVGGDCGVVAVLSGDFVQRGENAIYSKFARAEAAVRCGCDRRRRIFRRSWSILLYFL